MVTKEQMTQLRAMKRTSDNTRNIFLPTWKAIAQAVDPSELRGLDHAKPAEASLADYCKMYDTTAAESAALFADGLQAYAFGQTSDWFRVRPEEDRYYETDDQKAYFQKCERHMMKQNPQKCIQTLSTGSLRDQTMRPLWRQR